MVYVQQPKKGTFTVSLTKIVARTLNIKKGDQIVFVPMEGKPDSFELRLIR